MQRLYPGGLRFLLPIPFSMPLQLGQSYKRLCEVSFGQFLTANLPLRFSFPQFAFEISVVGLLVIKPLSHFQSKAAI